MREPISWSRYSDQRSQATSANPTTTVARTKKSCGCSTFAPRNCQVPRARRNMPSEQGFLWAVTGSNRRPLRCMRVSGCIRANGVIPVQRRLFDVFAGQPRLLPALVLDLVGLLAAARAPQLLHDDDQSPPVGRRDGVPARTTTQPPGAAVGNYIVLPTLERGLHWT
jgi:hypothetical protein